MHYDRYFNSYKDSLVYKIDLKFKGRPPVATLDDAMTVIRTIHRLTRGLRQIVYLVGWQFDGHDSKYPSWEEVGTQCISSFSPDPTESLRRMIRAAAEYNAAVSLHINMIDAYANSPLWDAYVAEELIARNSDGSLRRGCEWGGEQAYDISPVKELRSGRAQRRILGLLEMLPELRQSATIHIDALMAKGSPRENITIADDLEVICEITDFWHEQGIDVTTEILTAYDHIGYFPMVYHHNLDEAGRLKYPPDLLCGGNSEWNTRSGVDFYNFDGWPIKFICPAGGCLYDEAWGRNYPHSISLGRLANLPEFIDEFFRTSIVCRFLNRFMPLKHTQTAEEYKVEFSGGVTSAVDVRTRRLTVFRNGRPVVDGDDFFLDLEPEGKPLMLIYSKSGCEVELPIPEGFMDRSWLDMRIFPAEEAERLPVVGGKVRLRTAPGCVVSLC